MLRQGRTSFLLFGVAIAASLSAIGSANAQYPAGIYGPRPIGVFPYGYLGYYPSAYSSSWSNGFSLYGPPVPTYGSVPGSFGGADYRLNNIYIQNGASIGLGNSGAGGAGPRRRHWYGGDSALSAASPAMGQAIIDVRVPEASAEVLFEGTKTNQQGTRRVFQSPAVQFGTTYYYKVQARWKQPDGRVIDQTKSVGIRANETFVVDFTGQNPADDRQQVIGQP